MRVCFLADGDSPGVDRDRAAQVVGHERGFSFRVYDPEGVPESELQKVVEAVEYPGLEIGRARGEGV